jgi:hypothetical protein
MRKREQPPAKTSMNRSFILILMIAVNTVVVYSQPDQARREISGKEIRGRELEWSDFTGQVDANSRWNAYTDWVTSYRFSRPDFAGGRARVKLTVQLLLTRNSWAKPERKSQELLEHERGHFNIGRICSKQIEQAVNSSFFSASNYPKEIDDMYWNGMRKCKEFEERYDIETKHYNDREQQVLWNQKIADLLKKN